MTNNHYQEALDKVVETTTTPLCAEIWTLQMLVDKATPREPEVKSARFDNKKLLMSTWFCPRCFTQFEASYFKFLKYCPNCGQCLDWESVYDKYWEYEDE